MKINQVEKTNYIDEIIHTNMEFSRLIHSWKHLVMRKHILIKSIKEFHLEN
jgi:hypothetical protein